MSRRLLVILFLAALGFGLVALYFIRTQLNELSFSSTQTWGPEYAAFLAKQPSLVPDAYERITVEPAPLNTSAATKKDVALLHSYIQKRNDTTIAMITAEQELKNITYGERSMADILHPFFRPHTNTLIETSLDELNVLIIHYKEQFDRVRPSYLDTSLSTVLPVPPHPAYPSGHACQSYFVALLLSDLDPPKREFYLQAAERVAHNREIAGLHYPSDSKAGQDLASQYYHLLKETPWYAEAFAAAQAEWNRNID